MPNININWDPPATLYIFEANLYCPDCAKGIERDLISQGYALCQGMDDSDSWPQEYSRGEGETDSPDHCGNIGCQRFLGRNLTEDGVECVKRWVAYVKKEQQLSNYPIIKGWCDFYGIDFDA